ncbi:MULTISPECIES: hypothetical protein [Bacillaceae]|uniref:hypothetical protein n=1 Tax=Bacillaceae TaxID=186817 RepID=UPI00099BE80C|nr:MULTISPECIES: hypothetical protein [Bacillaceae]AQX53341.1 hypothetical protein BC359_02830 [Priestia flexa]TDB51763.1 hypothetical protein EPL02_08420 [Bacillus sp. CBEL-1]
MKQEARFSQNKLAKLSNVPEATIRRRRHNFAKYFSPVRQDGQLLFTKYDYYKMVFIQGLKSTSPPFSKEEIDRRVKELHKDLEMISMLKEYFNKQD